MKIEILYRSHLWYFFPLVLRVLYINSLTFVEVISQTLFILLLHLLPVSWMH